LLKENEALVLRLPMVNGPHDHQQRTWRHVKRMLNGRIRGGGKGETAEGFKRTVDYQRQNPPPDFDEASLPYEAEDQFLERV
jgi:hypothetical protein